VRAHVDGERFVVWALPLIDCVRDVALEKQLAVNSKEFELILVEVGGSEA
jgi:hypothetical protein